MSLVAQWIHICTMKVKALGFKSHEWPFLAETFSLMTAHLTLRIYLQWVSIHLCPWWLSGQACVPWMIRVLGSNPIDCCNGFEKTYFHHFPVPFQAWWESRMMGLGSLHSGVLECRRPCCVLEGPTAVQDWCELGHLCVGGLAVYQPWAGIRYHAAVSDRPTCMARMLIHCATGAPLPPTWNSDTYFLKHH